MESLKIFDNFKFSDLNEDWIQSVWDGEFMIYNEPPDEYLMFLESEDMRLLLHESYIVVKAWLEENRDQNNTENYNSEISWNTLITMDVKVRALLAVLGYIIKGGHSKDADEEIRQSCLYAINLYFVLLAIPGSNAFNIFHSNLYQRAIETLNIVSEQLQPPIKKRNRTMNLDDLNITDELVNEIIILSPNEKEVLIKNLNIIICSFIMMIRSFWFKDHIQSLDITVHGLVEVTKIDDDCIASQYFNKQIGTLDVSLTQNAYVALKELCDSKHGPVEVTITFIAKYILPRLLCNHMEAQVKVIANIREHTINFLKNLLHTYEKEAKTAILTLIQHIMLTCPDRLEARQRQASVLLKLLGICKQNIVMEAFKDLILLSHHSKIAFRLFAQEIIGKLLLEAFLINCYVTDSLKAKIQRTFFAIVLSRCMDCSSMVRGKAMAIIAEFTESDSETDKEMFQIIFEELESNKQFLPFHDIKNSLSTDIDLLPGSNVLLSMLTERIEDERAMVRRSTLQILRNLILMFPFLIHEVTSIISFRCRDPALTVRRFAVQVLSQLLQQFPDNPDLLNEWVQIVIPQIFDIEIKVQEKVLEYLQELLLNRIQNVSVSIDNIANNLPWKILNVITNMKMRKHLSKACSLWVKNGVITNFVMKNIQSHIGTNNNIEAWVLLVALAENTNLPNMNKYFLNYQEIFAENNFYTSLVLQVLKYSWKSLDCEVLKDLHIYLYKCLQQFKINFGLISICLDIVHNIMHYLNPDKNNMLESNMINLIKISEIEIAKIFRSENEAIEATPNYLKAMFTLGHATMFCTYKISPLTLRILQGVLLEWEALPEIIKEIEELQPSAVVILGQQALRDREIAKEVVPIFGRLMRQEINLHSIVQIAVKINAAKALADICVRFTALVEPYLPDMCVSMKNSTPQVREAIMVIFIQLLLEDYIKVKGPFFFHILTMLSDSDSMIRELTIFLIEERLLTKNKSLISQQFLQSIYHYNNYQSQHKVYHHKMREKEKKVLTLPRKANEEKRRAIYDFMLDHLDPPGKIKLLVKITSQILGGACVASIDVKKEEGSCVLKDALYIISNDRLRPSSFNRHNDDDQQEGEEYTAQIISPNSNALSIIVEGVRKHGLEVLLPMLIKLRVKLSTLKSPLENYVKRVLIKTYSEYNKDQLLNILSEYPKLEKEIEQFKKQVEDITFSDENSAEEENSPSGMNNHSASNKNLNLSTRKLHPKVVLRRLSVSQLSNCRNTPVNSLSSTSILDGWNTPTCSTPMLYSPSQPGPSTSSPMSFKGFDSNGTVGHASKVRRLSSFFQNENELISSHYEMRERNISQIRDDSESD
ncbi:Condensin-2 complex subunit D3 [Eufriesea mexicana]|uniref:condensin-2 complex subunit D3-like n=1 Tax=Eufriesea mexicana TaxID=516756 RepID=UPI00083BD403|nr:PREDICTED: condensin-2 complex subunit D3-like [Eufriesea mexicana]OAD60819.1 Condensin-2 complex subunit D3 [Eufriesea mexicana]